jgi:hypothetical protein
MPTTSAPIRKLGTSTLVAGACVIASSSFGCNASKPQLAPNDSPMQAQPGADRVVMGVEATNSHFSLRVLNTKACTLAPQLGPPPGIKKLAVELELHGMSNVEVPANPFYATLVDDKAQKFESTALGCAPMFAATRVVNGTHARGWVTFDVPESSVGQTIIYQPPLVGVASARAELELR